jgi:Sodium/calcium exchanger protein
MPAALSAWTAQSWRRDETARGYAEVAGRRRRWPRSLGFQDWSESGRRSMGRWVDDSSRFVPILLQKSQIAINQYPFDMVEARTPWWAWTWPLLAWAVLLMTPFVRGGLMDAAAGVALITTVFAAVYHAEVVAHRTGEPFGTLVLAVAVTIIEVALIVSVMVAAPAEKTGLVRDTVFAAVMIVCNGIVGLCLLWGGAQHHEQGFQVHGASAALAVLAALTTLTLILPNVTTTVPGPLFSTSQLVFEGIISLVLFSSKPCGTAIISFVSAAKKPTRHHPPTRQLSQALFCCLPPSWQS